MAGSLYFVSGIDTGVGKSVVTGMMAGWLHHRGCPVATVKMIQTGCTDSCEDLELHRQIMGIEPLPEDGLGLTAPQIFAFPASPLFAARREGRQVDLPHICQSIQTVAQRYKITLVEGAGGLAVPLTADCMTIQLVAQQGWPVLLVTSGKLGSINHTVLSMMALRQYGIPLAGVLYNYCAEADPEIDQDSYLELQRIMSALGENAPLIRTPKYTPGMDLTQLDFSPIFPEINV